MKLNGLLSLSSMLLISASIGTGLFMTKSEQPFNMLKGKFCPVTANAGLENERISQKALDEKFCRYSYNMLEHIYKEQEFKSPLTLPKGSFQLIPMPKIPVDYDWFFISISAAGMAIVFAKVKCDATINQAHNDLEGYKTKIKLDNTRTKQSRQFVKEKLELDFGIQRVKSGLIDSEELLKERKEKGEIRDMLHTLSLTEIEAQKSELLKKIAENQKAVKSATGGTDKKEKKGGKEAVIEMIKNHEDGWLWKVIEFQKPVWLTGEAGSGKSTTASAIVFCREHLLGVPLEEIIDPHYGINKLEAWKWLDPKQVFMSDDQIIGGFLGQVERWKAKCQGIKEIKNSIQLLVDEFTNHSQNENKDIQKASSIWMSASLTDPRKAQEMIVGVSHYLTNVGMGGASGTAEARKRGLITIQRKTNDGKKPIAKALLTGIYDHDGELLEDFSVTVPDWFRCEALAKMLEITEPKK